MTPTAPEVPRHRWIVVTTDSPAGGNLPLGPPPLIDVRCHRRLRGPYTGGGTLLRYAIPELMAHEPDLVAARATEVVTIAQELAELVPPPPKTLTNLAEPSERTRFYASARTMRLAHGAAELLMDWARLVHPGGVVVAFHDLDDADATDIELLSVLLRRCDPAVLTLVVRTDGTPGNEALALALATYADPTAVPPEAPPRWPDGTDLAQVYIDSDGTGRDPALVAAYERLDPAERVRRHDARADALAARGEPTLGRGAIVYHRERGSDPYGVGGATLLKAVNECFSLGFYAAVMELAREKRYLIAGPPPSPEYWELTNKIGACLAYLNRADESFAYFEEIRRGTTDGNQQMNASYMQAMMYTRHLPKPDHDEDKALACVNNAVSLADRHPDPHRRAFVGAFMRNAKALVMLHRLDLQGALDLVNEAIKLTDDDLGPDEQLLHRSVLLYNRAQILAAIGAHEGSLRDYDEVIRRDPDYGDYYFERGGQRRVAGDVEGALADYAEAIRLSPPFHEAHFNRADLLRELGDDEGALRDLDRALVLEPDHLDSLVNRVDVLLSLGEVAKGDAEVTRGLALDPANANLLTARGSLLAEAGKIEAALAAYTDAVTADPDLAAAWVNRAVLRYGAGQVVEAVADLDRAIALSDDPALRANRALALADLGEHASAAADLDAAIAGLGQDNPDLYYRRGSSRFALDDLEGARADWRMHLAAYGTQVSPFADDIRLRDAELVAAAPESAL